MSMGMPLPGQFDQDPARHMTTGEATTRLTLDHVLVVEERLERLLLVSTALWELLEERTGLTEAELLGKVAEVDARDGVMDGRLHVMPAVCPGCGRAVYPRHQVCLYCGAKVTASSAFNSV